MFFCRDNEDRIPRDGKIYGMEKFQRNVVQNDEVEAIVIAQLFWLGVILVAASLSFVVIYFINKAHYRLHR
jgi:hypothetical protein